MHALGNNLDGTPPYRLIASVKQSCPCCCTEGKIRTLFCALQVYYYFCKMKRFITFLISVFVLLIAVHPVFAFHFCSGKLASVGITSLNTSRCCSETSSDNTSEKFIKAACCHTSVLELSTDDYLQQDAYPQTQPLCVWVFTRVQSLVADLVFDSDSTPPCGAPPGCFYTGGRDLLMRFCVYLI